jgi:hypothetical protein
MDGGQGKQDKDDKPGASLTVTVHNEDAGGAPVLVKAGPGTPVSTIIDRFYTETKTERKPNDRLVCLRNGQDVFAHAGEHLGDYQASQCSALEWGWSGETGGA